MTTGVEIKIRGYHCDFYGHVNNARYLEFLEEGRWQRLESTLDLTQWAAQGLIFLVVNININYRRAVGVGETVRVTTSLEKIGARSAVLGQEVAVQPGGQVAADAQVTFVVADAHGKAVSLTGTVRQQLERLLVD
jgi:thioesterase III